jgi:PilZ domain
MVNIDWRQSPRFSLHVPLWIRPIATPQSASQHAQTSDISRSGLSIVSDLPLPIGTPVELLLKMPREVIGEPAHEWCCRGRVVRVGEPDPVRRTRTIGVKFQYYEVLDKETGSTHDLVADAVTRRRRR